MKKWPWSTNTFVVHFGNFSFHGIFKIFPEFNRHFREMEQKVIYRNKFGSVCRLLALLQHHCHNQRYNQQNDPRVGLLTRDATLINFLLPRNLSLCSVASQTFEVPDLFDEKLPLITAMVLMIPSVNLIVDPAV